MATLEGAIITALISEIRSQLVNGYGIDTADLEVSKGNQTSAQYSGASPTTVKYQVFLSPVTKSKINTERVDSIDGSDLTANYTHMLGITYQIDCLTDYEAGSGNLIAGDLLEIISDLLQHYDAIANLKTKGVFLESCGNVRPSYTIMNQGAYESTPSFDLKVTYNSKFAKITPSVSTVTGTTEGL